MKENTVYLYGQVSVVQLVKSGQNFIKAMMVIKTKGQKGTFSTPLILSRNKEIMEKMSWIKEGDMIRIKGVLSTENLYKAQICPFCGQKNRVKGIRFCVIPIALYCEERNLTEEEGQKKLEEDRCSNNICIAGTICNAEGAIFYQNESETLRSASYQIASNRKFFIKEDTMHIKTDYPWIRTFGNQAVSDAKKLKQGSEVFIKGFVNSRDIKRKSVCEHCKSSYSWWDQAGEVIANEVCYLDELSNNSFDSGFDQVVMFGRVEDIRISANTTSADLVISVMPHINFFYHYSAEIYSIMLLARTKEEVEKIRNLKIGDYIFASGTISGAATKKKIICNCKKECSNEGILFFIYPDFIKKIRDPLHQSLNLNLMQEHKEISNNVSFAGIVSSKPAPIFSEKNQTCVYYILMTHVIKIEQGEIEKKEKIRICSTGKQAKEDMLRLIPGTKVFINGFLRTWEEEKSNQCDCCNEEYRWRQQITEVVPYSVEYLGDYLSDQIIKNL